jgi:hypothetical protein
MFNLISFSFRNPVNVSCFIKKRWTGALKLYVLFHGTFEQMDQDRFINQMMAVRAVAL